MMKEEFKSRVIKSENGKCKCPLKRNYYKADYGSCKTCEHQHNFKVMRNKNQLEYKLKCGYPFVWKNDRWEKKPLLCRLGLHKTILKSTNCLIGGNRIYKHICVKCGADCGSTYFGSYSGLPYNI